MAEAEIIQLGSRGPAGRGSRSRPSAAARGLARPGRGARPASAPAAEPPETGEAATRAARAEGARPSPPTAAADPDLDHGGGGLPETDEAGAAVGAPDADADADEQPDGPDAAGAEESPAGADDGWGPSNDDPAGAGRTDGEIPPTVDVGAVLAELSEAVTRMLERLRSLPVEQIREFAGDPVRGVLALAQRLGVDGWDSLEEVAAFVRSRLAGDYAVDEFGFDPELTIRVYLPVLRLLAQSWFRVEVRGAENIPTTGAALLVSNHAGTLPLDGMILQSVVYDEIGRHVRMLGADLIFATPYTGDMARKTGTTLACQEDTERLLANGQLVSVYPEGFKGLGKLYADRYKLQRFGRGGFVSAAVRAQVPIVPISVVGSEEIYPLLSTAPTLARALGFPYFPVTPTFPWFGLLGAIPLPSKWIIQVGEAITTDELPAGSADDPMVVFNVTDQVRETIQQTLYALLMQRRSAFF